MKYVAVVNGKKYEVDVERLDGYKSLDRNGVAAQAVPAEMIRQASAPAAVSVAASAPAASAPAASAPAASAPAPAAAPASAASEGAASVEAPLAGKVLKINAQPGQAVKFGEAVIIMEAMKMETEIVAPQDGVVDQILVKAGDMVEAGTVMVTLK